MQKQTLMKLRKTVAVMATAAMTMAMPVTSLAAPAAYTQTSTVSQESAKNLMNVDLHPIFDAAVYAANNQDVVSQVGDSPEALYNHFITVGINQNRKFNSKFSMNDSGLPPKIVLNPCPLLVILITNQLPDSSF